MRRHTSPQIRQSQLMFIGLPQFRKRRGLRAVASNRKWGLRQNICFGLVIYLIIMGTITLYYFEYLQSLFAFDKRNSDATSLQRILNIRQSFSGNAYSGSSQMPRNGTNYSSKISSKTKLLNTLEKLNDAGINHVLVQPQELSKRKISELVYPDDYQKFTIRINTWKREEQLNLSIRHYLSCSSVGQIQVVWCIAQGEPPVWLLNAAITASEKLQNNLFRDNNLPYPSLVVEMHVNNTLNERFRALMDIPTSGVLSIDDDVIRPCVALDAAFVKWTQNPDRQVGFDARSHEIQKTANNSEIWSYGYMSTTEKLNKYSITLTRFSFLHRDYLFSYWVDMPSQVRDMVTKYFNCEDIAMSLWISANTDGQPPLLADYWAVKSQIKIAVEDKISAGNNHKSIRNRCMDIFAELFMLKGRLKATTLFHRHDRHGGLFEYGAETNNTIVMPCMLHNETKNILERWKNINYNDFLNELSRLTKEASKSVYERGLIENTPPWKDRFHAKKKFKKASSSFSLK